MDINQQDRMALNARICPDCGGAVIFEENDPWCKSCDVWFEFSISGWVIRNSDAAQFFSMLQAAKKGKEPDPEENEGVHEKSVMALKDIEPEEYKKLPGQTQIQKWREIHAFVLGQPVTNTLGHSDIPISLFRWFG